MAPKRESLLLAESSYGVNMAKLHIKQAELQVITTKLNQLNENLNFKQQEKEVQYIIQYIVEINHLIDHQILMIY